MPFYIPLAFQVDLRILRALRLMRMARLFKIGRYSESMQILSKVLRDKKEEIFICLYIGGILLVVASSIMYYLEHSVQPEQFPLNCVSLYSLYGTSRSLTPAASPPA